MAKREPNYLWKKSATPEWLERHEEALVGYTGGTHSIVEKPGRRHVAIECFCQTRSRATRLIQSFGGKSVRLPPDWMAKFVLSPKFKTLRIGRRLTIQSGSETEADPARLIIPAGAAFGTGEHATTAMSLRLLEGVTRGWAKGWRMLDAGTGSGVLALAGSRFGAGEVFAIDNDPLAIKTAKWNARENGIRGVEFRVSDVTRALAGRFDLITANLFSELLIAVLPRLKRALTRDGHLILSGVMRTQEPAVRRALRANGFRVEITRRRGKWIALLAASSSYSYS